MASVNDNINSVAGTGIPAHAYPKHEDMLAIQASLHDEGGLDHVSVGAAYGFSYLQQTGILPLLRKHVGKPVVDSAMADLGFSISWLLDEPSERDHCNVMPLFGEILMSTLKVALTLNRTELFQAQWEFYTDIIANATMDPPFMAIFEKFGEVYELLADASVIDEEVTDSAMELTNQILATYAVPYGTLPQATHGQESAPQALPAEVTPKSAEPNLPEIFAGDNRLDPAAIEHYDGSLGIDIHEDLAQILSLKELLPRLESSEDQFKLLLERNPGPVQEIIQIWSLTRRHALEGVRITDFRAADAAVRLMKYLFTAEQLKILTYRVPAERLMDNFLNYVTQQRTVPHQSAAQVRISCTAAAISCIARENNIIPTMRALWSDLGLPVREADLMEKIMMAQMDVLMQSIRSELPAKHELVLH